MGLVCLEQGRQPPPPGLMVGRNGRGRHIWVRKLRVISMKVAKDPGQEGP